MIAPGTQLRIVAVPLARIVVTEHQPRYPARVEHYYRLFTDPTHRESHAGLVHLAWHDALSDGAPLYTLLDGHHRLLAAILAGRTHLLALLHVAPGDPGYEDDAHAEGADEDAYVVAPLATAGTAGTMSGGGESGEFRSALAFAMARTAGVRASVSMSAREQSKDA